MTPTPERILVRDHDGNVFRLTPDEWNARDAFDGWTRIDEHGHDLTDDGAPVPPDEGTWT